MIEHIFYTFTFVNGTRANKLHLSCGIPVQYGFRIRICVHVYIYAHIIAVNIAVRPRNRHVVQNRFRLGERRWIGGSWGWINRNSFRATERKENNKNVK